MIEQGSNTAVSELTTPVLDDIIEGGHHKILATVIDAITTAQRAHFLVIAAKVGNTECLKILIDAGVEDQNYLNGALYQAILTGICENITLLRKAGASVQWCNVNRAVSNLRKQTLTRSLSNIMAALA